VKRMMALVAVSRKFLGIIYAIVRDDSEYSVNRRRIPSSRITLLLFTFPMT
jgi:hypothetical protein